MRCPVRALEYLSLTAAWRDPEHMVLGERRQTQKDVRTVCGCVYVSCPEQEHPQTRVGSWLLGWERRLTTDEDGLALGCGMFWN